MKNRKEITKGQYRTCVSTVPTKSTKMLSHSLGDYALIIAGLLIFIMLMIAFPSMTTTIFLSVAAGMFVSAGLLGLIK